jgi:hypothetical protein
MNIKLCLTAVTSFLEIRWTTASAERFSICSLIQTAAQFNQFNPNSSKSSSEPGRNGSMLDGLDAGRDPSTNQTHCKAPTADTQLFHCKPISRSILLCSWLVIHQQNQKCTCLFVKISNLNGEQEKVQQVLTIAKWLAIC